MIGKEEIESIKTGIDLKSYITQSTGNTFKKNGKGYVCRCPFPDHEDTNPSFIVTPSENLFHCFGCNRGGDIFKFDELYFNLDFSSSVKKHKRDPQPTRKPRKKNTRPNKDALTVKEKKLLNRVASFYQFTLTEDPKALDYLKNERGIKDMEAIKDFGAGYANGTLLNLLPNADPGPKETESDLVISLKRIGILNQKGKELFNNCAVFPMYDESGAVVNLYGRSIDPESDVKHLYLPGKLTGFVNRQAVKRSQTLFLTESIIDALTLYDQGFKNVMPIYGTNGFTHDHLSFFNRKIKEIYLVFDADESGKKAAEKVSLQLKEKDIRSHIVTLPDKDVNIYFNRHTPEEFETLLRQANPRNIEQSSKIKKRQQTLYKETGNGFIVGFGERQYEIKGIQRGDTQLKVTIKASADVEKNLPFELTTIDLYSSRSRVWFSKLCADLLGATEALIKEDLGKLLNLVESYNPRQKKENKHKPTKTEKAEALRFLKSENIFNEILKDLETLGITGEETNKLVGYLAAVSRKLDEPLSVLIQSRSAAGKSTLQDAVLSLVPEEDYVKYTRITDQALFYKDEDSLVNKILAIEEEVGMGGAAYSIRNIQSSKKITVAATGKDPGTGKMKTEEYTVRGPVAVMITTTAADVEGETASRFLFLTIDESSDMTEAIHQKQRESETLEGLVKKKKSESIIKKHQTAQRLLKPLAVVNPFTKYLTYPSKSLRTRRDHKKYLGLIRAIAFIHQYQREIQTVNVEGEKMEYIEVTLEDIDNANSLANEVLGQCMDELAKPSRTLLSLIYKMVKQIMDKKDITIEEIYFTRRMIREFTGWTDWQVRAHIKQLEEMQYLYARVGRKGKEYAYALNYKGQAEEGGKCYLNLTPVEEIKKLIKKDDPDFEG